MIDYKECWEQLEIEIKDLKRFCAKMNDTNKVLLLDSLLQIMRKMEEESQIESQRREMAKGCPF